MQTETTTPARAKGRRPSTADAATAEAARPAKAPKSAKAAPKAAGAHQGGPAKASKAEAVMKLLQRAKGATGAEIQDATKWQPHTVRGFISATKKKKGIAITSTKTEGRGTVYKATKAAD